MRLKSQNLRFIARRQLLAVLGVALLLCTIFAGLVVQPDSAQAATSSTINFQARLMNGSGSIAADGDYNVEFKLYDVASGGGTAQGVCTGNCKWVETRTTTDKVHVANGYLTVNLGSVTAFGAGINWDQDLWLTMNIGGTGAASWDGEMSPRLKLTAVPYAFRAGKLAVLSGGNTAVLEFASSIGQATTITLPDPGGAGTATVCYQNSASCGFLTGAASDYIQNGTTVQTNANFNIRSSATGSVTGVLQGANGQTADILQVQTWNGTSATTVFNVNSAGLVTASAGLTATGTVQINASSNNNTSINTGTSTGTVSIGNSAAGALSLQSGSTLGIATTNFNLSTAGVVTLAGGQTIDVTTAGDATATAITVQPGTSSGATSNGPALNLRGGDASGTSSVTGGAVAISGGSATGGSGTRTGGSVSIDAGTGATANGTVSIGTTNAASLSIGRTGVTTTNNGALAVTQGLTANGGVTVAGGQNLTLQNGSGVFGQTFASGVAASAQTLSVTNSNSGGSSIAVNGHEITLVGTATSGGTNSNSAFLFNNPSAATNNNFYGLNFAGTGYTDILRVNGSQIISGAGVLQNAGLSSSITYSNLTKVGALDAGSITTGFGTISTGNNISTTAAIQGGTATFTGANALTLGTTGTNTGAIVFRGSTASSGTITLVGAANPSTNNYTLTIPTLTGNANICTDNAICSGYQAAGSYESPLTFDNGLTRTVNTVSLGGTLNQATTIQGGNSQSLSVTSDLTGGARTANLLTLSQADNGTNNMTAGSLLRVDQLDVASTSSAVYIDNNSTAAAGYALTVDNANTTATGAAIRIIGVAGANVRGIDITGVTTGTGIQLAVTTGTGINANTVTTGPALTATGLTTSAAAAGAIIVGGTGTTTGVGLQFNATANTATTAKALNVSGAAAGITADYSGAWINVNPTRTLTAAATRTDSGQFLNLTRSNTVTNASATYNVTGALALLQSNCTQTAGTCADSANILHLNQQYANASGAVLNIQGAGTGNLATLDATNTSANGISLDLQSSSTSQFALNLTSNNGATNILSARADGNVGLGTTSPDSKLHVIGGLCVEGSDSGCAAGSGTVIIQGANALTLGATGTNTGAIVFRGSTAASGTITLVGAANPSTNNYTLTIPTLTANANVCTDNSICSGYQAAPVTGSYIQTVPTGTVNTIQPTAASVVALTVNGTSNGTGATALVVNQTQDADAVNISTSSTGTNTNGLLISRSSAGTTTNGLNITNATGTTTNAIAITQTSGTVTNGIAFAGTIGTDITRATGTLSLQGGGGMTVATNSVTRATFDTSNNLYLGNGATAASPNNFAVLGTGSTTAGTAGANLTLQGGAGASATTGSAGGNVLIAGGNAAGSGNNAGGNVTLQGGLDANSGTPGKVLVKNSADSATAFEVQNAAGTSTILDVDTTNGFVGIGTAAPARPVHVVVNNSTVNGQALKLEQAGSGDVGVEFTENGQSFYAGVDSTDHKFKISSSAVGSTTQNMGYTTIGGTADSANRNFMNATKFTAGATGSVNTIYAYIESQVSASPNNKGQAAIYTDSSGSPGTLLGNSLGDTTLTGAAWNAFPISSVNVTNGTTYWLVYNTNAAADTDNNIHFDAGGVDQFKWKAQTYGTWATPYGVPDGDSDNQGSIYAVITTGTSSNNFLGSLFQMSATGETLFQNSTDSTNAFLIQNVAGVNMLGLDTVSSILNLGVTGTTATASTVNIATSTGAIQNVTVGGAGNNNSVTLIQGGNSNTAGSEAIRLIPQTAGGILIGGSAGTGTITLGRSTATNIINIGNGTTANGNTQTVNIATAGTGTGKAAITIGNANGASTLVLQAGTGTATGDINIGDQTVAGKIIDIGSVDNAGTSTVRIATGAAVQGVTIGSTNSTSTTVIQGGTGTATGDINIGDQATASKIIDIGSVDNAGTGTVRIATGAAVQTVTIGSTSSTSTTTLQGGTGNANGDINIGDQTTAGKIIDIGSVTNAGTSTVRIATGAAVQTVTLGSTNTTSTTTIQGGTGTATGDINIGDQATASKIIDIGSVDNAATGTVRIATGAAVQTVTVGSTNSTSTLTLQGGTGNANGDINIGDQTTAGKIIDIGSVTNAGTSTVRIATGAAVQTVTVGSTNTTSTLTLQGGTGTATGDINIGDQATAGKIIDIGSVDNAATGTVRIATGAAVQGVTIGSTNSTSTLTLQGGTGTATGDINIGDQTTAGKIIHIGSVDNAGTGTIRIATAAAVQDVMIGSTNGASTTRLQAGSNHLIIDTGGTVRATFDGAGNNVYFGNGVTAGTPNAFAIRGTGSSTTAVAGAALTIQGGNATVGTANGGNVILAGGTGIGGGVKGLVVVDTATFSTASSQSSGVDVAVTQANIDSSGAVVLNASASGVDFTLSDPTLGANAAGRLLYVIAANGSQDFTLRANVGEGVSIEQNIAMRQNTTATMIWTGSNWTAAGASSSTTLQAAYDNTLSSAGSAEIVLNNTTTGLTIRNNTTTPIVGGLLEVQTSIGTNLFSVNNNISELVANGGAEDSTNFATNWTSFGTATITRNTTTNQYATGVAGAQFVSTTANSGIRNNLASNPATSTVYMVSFAARLETGSPAFTDMTVQYTPNGGTNTVNCLTGQTVVSTEWRRFTCEVNTGGTAVTNPDILIFQVADPGASNRTVYIDNLSMTLADDAGGIPNNVQIGGGIYGGAPTLFTLDRSSAPPVANGNTTYLGSMYYDTTSGRIQCYESDGWGACGSAPDNIITLAPEYTGAVLNGTGVGTMTADFCANQTSVLQVNTSFCASGISRNYYKWTSPQASQQTYSIYVSYKLPSTFKSFNDANTIKLTALSDDTTNAVVDYQVFRSTGSAITSCGSQTTVTTTDDTWQQVSFSGDETACGFVGGDYIIFKVNVRAEDNANVYVENLDFVYLNT
jgi:hypothetical protein